MRAREATDKVQYIMQRTHCDLVAPVSPVGLHFTRDGETDNTPSSAHRRRLLCSLSQEHECPGTASHSPPAVAAYACATLFCNWEHIGIPLEAEKKLKPARKSFVYKGVVWMTMVMLGKD